MRELTDEQLAAVERRSGPVVLSAAAGSGKTTVLSERFVRAVADDRLDPARILAITFTNEAAAELKRRIRALLLERGERRAAQQLDGAQIGTIHSFCARILRSHAIDVGVPPGFTTLDATQARILMADAWAATLERAVVDDAALDLLAYLGADTTRKIVVDEAFQSLRSRGQRHPRLPSAEVAEPGAAERWALATLATLGVLLTMFDEEYERVRFGRGAVDFDDLELLAGELLADEAIANEWAERFDLLMIDEFQDSNLRQLAVLKAIDRDNLFTVGDEMQAIYGFRDAEPGLLRGRRIGLAAQGASLELTGNFRSAAPILKAVGRIFLPRPYNEFSAPVAMVPGSSVGPVVELLVVARESSHDAWGDERLKDIGGPAWRAAEALLLARRIAEIVDAGEARAGEVAVLLRARGDMTVFERALRMRGLRTVAVVGDYWEDEQVQDLLNVLRVVANPRDTVALYSVLAGPLGGLDADAMALIALRARELGIGAWELLHRPDGTGVLGGEQEASIASLARHLAALHESAPLAGVADLIERTVRLEGYRDHVFSLADGRRRMANVHKLLHLAAEWESIEGRDLRGFLDHVASLEGTDEREAPATNGDLDAVRLMTIHGAKGLEFPVVAVADLGREPNVDVPALLIDSPRVGLRLRAPGEEKAAPYFDHDELKAERLERERGEEDRVLYVGMTRAERRLILSGAADQKKWSAACDGEQNGGVKLAPIHWVGATLWSGLDFTVDQTTISEPALDVNVRTVSPETADRLFAGLPGGGGQRRADPAPPPPPGSARADVAPPDHLSYTALSELERCAYRYYLQRSLGLPERARGGDSGLAGRARGTLVHAVLERDGLDADAPAPVARIREVAAAIGISVDDAAAREVAALLERAARSDVAARIAAAGGRREVGFALALQDDLPLIEGFIDALLDEGDGRWLVFDYKSDRLDAGDEPAELFARHYGLQREIYALAALRAGARSVEVVHWFLERPDAPVAARYDAGEGERLRAGLARRVRDALASGYAVTRHPGADICGTCPGLGGLCSYTVQEALGEVREAGS